jgi:hypothetical protein
VQKVVDHAHGKETDSEYGWARPGARLAKDPNDKTRVPLLKDVRARFRAKEQRRQRRHVSGMIVLLAAGLVVAAVVVVLSIWLRAIA